MNRPYVGSRRYDRFRSRAICPVGLRKGWDGPDGFGSWLTPGEAAPAVDGAGDEGAAQAGASAQARAAAAAGDDLHQDGSSHEWLEGRPALDLIVTLDDATGAIYSAFLVEEEGTGLDLPGAQRGVRRTRAADEPLHRPRRPLYPYPREGRRYRPRAFDAGRAQAARRRAYRRLSAA
jgi:hypothetical protein